MIHALVAEAVRYGRRLLWLVVPTLVLAVIAIIARSAPEREWRVYDDLPRVTVRKIGPAQSPESIEDDLKGSLTLRGQILDPDGRPAADAEVSLDGRAGAVRTADDGTFTFTELWPGAYTVSARKDRQVAYRVVAVREHSGRAILKLRPERVRTLFVHALELDGRTPIVGAKVNDDDGHQGVTGPDGSFTIERASRGAFVTVSSPGHGAVGLSTVVPEVDHRLVPVETVPPIHVTALLPPAAPIGGTVVDPMGRPVPSATVSISTIETETWHRDPASLHTDENGAWRLQGLAAGTYALTASSPTFTYGKPIRLTVDGKTARGDIVFHADSELAVHTEYGAQLVGTVLDADGRPAVGAEVLVHEWTHWWTLRTNVRGEFRLLGVQADQYEIAAWLGSQASQAYRVDLVRNKRIDVELRLVESKLAGSVVDSKGQPLADMDVSVHDYFRGLYFYDRTDADGHYDLGGVPPGTYRVSLPDNAASVRATAGKRDVQLVMPGLTTITGRVLFHGAPVRTFGLYINYIWEYFGDHVDWRTLPRVETVDGRFAKDGVRAGRRQIVIAGEGFAPKAIDVEIPEGDVFDLGDVNVDSPEVASPAP